LPDFEKLVKKIYDRNFEIGECFDKSITFISYQNEVLTWQSNATKDCKKTLRDNWGIIRLFVQEVYGIETKIRKGKDEK
jgi:DNA polymerase-3 subunit gamma/tau